MQRSIFNLLVLGVMASTQTPLFAQGFKGVDSKNNKSQKNNTDSSSIKSRTVKSNSVFPSSLNNKKMPVIRRRRMLALPPAVGKGKVINLKNINLRLMNQRYRLTPAQLRALQFAATNQATVTKEIDGMTCTYQPVIRDRGSLQQNAISLAEQNKWGGALIQARTRNGSRSTSGNFVQYALPDSIQRRQFNLVTSQSSLPPERVSPPSRSGYDRALGRLVRGHSVSDVGGEVTFFMAKTDQVESVMAMAGINGSGLTWSGSFTGQTESSRQKNTVTVLFLQKPFTTAVDYGSTSPAVGLLGPESLSDLPADWRRNAAYISSITYGKILIMRMESLDTLDKMTTALNASLSGLTSRGSTRLSTEHSNTLRSAKYSVWSQGGDNRSILRTIRLWAQGRPGQSLDSYFSSDNERLSVFPAISFSLNYLSTGNQVSNSTIITEFSETCRQNSQAMKISLIYNHLETEDYTGADEVLFSTLNIDGRSRRSAPISDAESWGRSEASLNDGDSAVIYQNTCVEVPLDRDRPDRILEIESEFWDEDTQFLDSNDRIWGRWFDNVNLSELARRLRSSNRAFTHLIRRDGRDGALGQLDIRVSPQANCN